VFSAKNNLFLIVMLLVASTAVDAAPTVETDNLVVSTAEVKPDVPAVVVPTGEIVEPVNARLANLGKELLQPPASPTVLGDIQGGSNVKSLPAAPAAVLMVLSGFLCVSLVRDRRVWLAVLTGLLWAGQVGIQVLPQLVLRFGHGNQSGQQLCASLAYPHYLENSNRLRSDIDGTQYIGLLHHLGGIPDAKSRYLHKYVHSYTSQLAIVFAQTGVSVFIVCLASGTKQFISFSQVFVFSGLSRGPPMQA
jgi:hypothetical protein